MNDLNPSKTILVVEDEPKLASLLQDYLKQSGYDSDSLAEGSGVVDWVRANEPDMILLDLMLPGKNGMEICQEIRRFSPVPIIMLTARVEEIDRLVGLELGADDYICKPYSPREVMVRIKAIFRRIDFTQTQQDTNQKTYRSLSIDEKRYICTLGDTQVELTPVEMRLLLRMIKNPGMVFNRTQLMDIIYTDQRVVSDRTIDSHIKNLRAKLKDAAPEIELIHSIYGIGYKLE